MGWAGHVARLGEKINRYELLANEGKIQLGRHKRRCQDNIQIDLKLYASVRIVFMWLKFGAGGGLL